jgi:glutaminase
MFGSADVSAKDAVAAVSTGGLPAPELIANFLSEAYDKYRTLDEGVVADYIPALARISRDLFGLCMIGVNGAIYAVGDSDCEFSIQSISKPFTFALVCDAVGAEPVRERIGVNATGLPFNSVMAIELNSDRTMNPMVNAGAIATTSLAPPLPSPEEEIRIAREYQHKNLTGLITDEEQT